VGATGDEAAYLFATLEKHCQVSLMVERVAANQNIQPTLVNEENTKYLAKFAQDTNVLYAHFQPEYNLLIEGTNGAFLK